MPAWQSLPHQNDVLARLQRALRRVLSGWLPSRARRYRPEKHYMRGPGPKSRSNVGGIRKGSAGDRDM